MSDTLVVLAKEPIPGRVKTRLSPPYSPAQAAGLAGAALADTLSAVRATPATRRLLVLEGSARALDSEGFEVRPQVPGGLDERLAAAFALAEGPTLLVGMDTPQVRPDLLAVDWSSYDAWFGPAQDGGFWALGLRRPDAAPVLGVPMSLPWTGAIQLQRLRAAGLRVGMLPVLADVDTAHDASRVAAQAPHTRFAACYRALSPAAASG